MNQIMNGFVYSDNTSRTSNSVDSHFVSASGGMNNNGWRRFRRDGIVPQDVFATLRQSGIVKQNAWIFEEETTVGELLDFLKCYPYESDQARAAGESLFRQIFKADIPSLSKTFAHEGNA